MASVKQKEFLRKNTCKRLGSRSAFHRLDAQSGKEEECGERRLCLVCKVSIVHKAVFV